MQEMCVVVQNLNQTLARICSKIPERQRNAAVRLSDWVIQGHNHACVFMIV